jgi:site-specific DNA recombinase
MGHHRKHEYTLGSMLECGHCHIAMSGMAKVDKGRTHRYFKCNAHHEPKKYGYKCDNAQFKADVVEAAVWGWIKSLLMEPDTLRRAIDEYQQQQQQRIQPQLSMLESSQARLAALEEQKTRLIDAYTKGVLSLNELASQKTAMDKEINALGQAINMLRVEAEPHLLTTERRESIEAFAAKLQGAESLMDANKQAQRAIFQALDVRVILSYDGQERWADCTCTLDTARYAVDSISSRSIARKSAR